MLAVNFAALYWLALREVLALQEYAQFFLLNPDSFEDQRRKFIEYLAGTGAKTTTQCGADAGKAVVRIAKNMRGQLTLANAASRNALVRKQTG